MPAIKDIQKRSGEVSTRGPGKDAPARDVSELVENQFSLRQRHRSTSAINGFEDKPPMFDSIKSMEHEFLTSDHGINSVDKSNTNRQNEPSEESKLVKSRISFFEEKELADVPRKVNLQIKNATSLPNLLDAQEGRKEEVAIEKNQFPPAQQLKVSGVRKKARCPFSRKSNMNNIRLKNYVYGTQLVDTLHQQAQVTHCNENRCMGSLMQPYGGSDDDRPYGVPRPKEIVKKQAAEFFDQYFASMKQKDMPAHKDRLESLFKEIDATGTYDLTYDELVYGAKLAWRNAPRCIGRIQWNNLKVFDARLVSTADEMFDSLCEHIEYATNGGNLRSTITIFRERREGINDCRIWNPQLVRYAGYEREDGSIIGDPAGVEFTKLCMKLGWKGPEGKFDVLPLVLQAGGKVPKVFDIPKHLVLQVQIKHPDYPWFQELGLQWYALPAVANMKLDVGGVEFPCSPFNGWYMVTEVGARDLGDTARYNMLEPIAAKMNLDTRSPASLWKDRAVTELNQAVLYSYKEAKVTLVDHHTASDQFVQHLQNEQTSRGGCPADWVWIVPPSNGSTTEVFHQEMLNYVVKPSYDYQDDAWKHYQFPDQVNQKKLTFKQAAIIAKITKGLMNVLMAQREKATVLYATETGKSEKFAKILRNLLSCAFDVNIYCMSDYKFEKLYQENLLMIVTSTFGNGEAPLNGEKFGEVLEKLKEVSAKPAKENGFHNVSKVLDGLRFAVFGLGSSDYPNYCAFAHSCRSSLRELGGREIHLIGEGDELCGQEDSFRDWAKTAFQAACSSFSIDQSKLLNDSDKTFLTEIQEYDPDHYKFKYIDNNEPVEICKGLSKLHGKNVQLVDFVSVEELQSPQSSRSTVLVKLDRTQNASLDFEPGDHVAIFPGNDENMVNELISLLHNAPHPDSPIEILASDEENDPSKMNWETVKRLPVPCSLRQALTRYIDITSPPSQNILKMFAKLAQDEDDQHKLKHLGENTDAYEDWKFAHFPNIVEVLEEMTSIKLNGLELLTQLPILQARYYSIASSPLMYPNEIHAAVAVVCYETQGNPKKIHNGVCSNWLSKLQKGDLVACYVRQAPSFRLPKQSDAPVIMIGPGTGISPLRSFWQERQKQREIVNGQNNNNEKSDYNWGSMDLYTGCRKSNEDDIFKEEKQAAVHDGTLSHAYLALSREINLQKTYVQDIMRRNAENVCKILHLEEGHVYVCGDVTMAADVNKTLCEIFQDQLGCTLERANKHFKNLKSAGRYHEDIFGVTTIPKRSKQRKSVCETREYSIDINK